MLTQPLLINMNVRLEQECMTNIEHVTVVLTIVVVQMELVAVILTGVAGASGVVVHLLVTLLLANQNHEKYINKINVDNYLRF